MINIAVYGNSKWSLLMKKLLEGEYSRLMTANGGEAIRVSAFVVENPQNEDEIGFLEFANQYGMGLFFGIVIPKEYYITHNHILLKLIRMGVNVDDIYDGIRLFEGIEEHEEYIPHVITPMLEDPYLPYLEFHVTDHCNLNCKYCTHYAPLVKGEVCKDFEEFARDLEQLRRHITDIGIIRILGGEPLLNPELPKFIEFTRKIYPGTVITVVTNGLLLDRVSDELLECMRENKAFFSISYYPPLEAKIGDVKKFLVEKKIPYALSEKIESFNMTQSLEDNEDEDFFYRCFQASCTCLEGGKVAACYAPFTTKYFNETFETSLPVDEGVDIYDPDTNFMNLKMKLLIPMERCRFCIDGKACKWEIIGKNSSIDDWV